MMKVISNWGRWGKDDEIGTFNLITPAVRRAAAALVTMPLPKAPVPSPPAPNESFARDR